MFVKAGQKPVVVHAGTNRASSTPPEVEAVACERILFVDDEENVLEGYKRLLHGEFEVETAKGGEQALAALRLLGPYAIVISDMRMPGLDGAGLLSRVRELAPSTVRMLLTGYKDMNSAIEAFNEGRIFRYLSKPCEKSELVHAIQLGLEQYRTNTEQKELLKAVEEIRHKADGLANVLHSWKR